MNEIYKNNLPCWAPHGRLCACFLRLSEFPLLFVLSGRRENDEYHARYDSAFTVLLPLKIFLAQKLAAIGSLSVLYARSQPNTTWPFVTLNDFQQRADDIRLLSNSLLSVLSQWF
jgi:hypothetical protein